MNFAVDMARSILEMQERIRELEYEVARLRDYEAKYNDLLNSSIEHSEKNMAGIFEMGMKLAGTGYFDKQNKGRPA